MAADPPVSKPFVAWGATTNAVELMNCNCRIQSQERGSGRCPSTYMPLRHPLLSSSKDQPALHISIALISNEKVQGHMPDEEWWRLQGAPSMTI